MWDDGSLRGICSRYLSVLCATVHISNSLMHGDLVSRPPETILNQYVALVRLVAVAVVRGCGMSG
jgi:hypothetical protein